MDVPERQPPVSEPLRSTPVPIAQLAPTLENLSDSSIHAVVTLLWPYSSSTQSISLLIAEPDFRLRRTNGQVKVVFHGHVAQEVAKSQVGIGDSVYVGLAGARFLDNDAAKQTPGRFIAWDVHFDNNVSIEVWRSSQHLSTLKIDRPSSPSPVTDDAIGTPSTPIANGRSHLDGLNPQAWQSPAFIDPSRKSLAHITRSTYDPSAEEDGYIPGKGRKRPRFSILGREWRIVDEPASPGDNDIPGDWTAMFDDDAWYKSDSGEDDSGEQVKESSEPTEMHGKATLPEESPDGVPAIDVTAEPVSETIESSAENQSGESKSDVRFLLPEISQRTEPPGRMRHNIPNFAGHLPIDTPRLHPIPSPGLPIPSPLVSSSNSPYGYFGSISATVQGLSTPPTTFHNQEIMDVENEAVSDAPPEASQAPANGHMTISSVGPEATALPPSPQIHGLVSGQENAHPVSAVESVAAETKNAEMVERAAHVEAMSPFPVYQTATLGVSEHMEVEGEPEGITSQERESSEAEEAREEPEERVIIDARHENSGFRIDASRTTDLDDEGSDSEGTDQSSVVKGSRSGDIVEDYDDIVEEDVEQSASETRNDVEIVSESETQLPVKSHEAVRKGYGYYIEEEDEDEDIEDDDVSGEDSEESEESEGIYDDEDRYDERVRSEYDSEDDDVVPEAPQPVRNAQPEIIVLDSDSDEEPAPAVQAPPVAHSALINTFPRGSESSAGLSDEVSGHGTSESDESEDGNGDEDEDEEVESESEEDEDEDERVGRDLSGSEAEEWEVQDNQEAQEPEVDVVDLDSADERSIESEHGDVLQSDEDQAAHEQTEDEQRDDEADDVKLLERNHENDGHPQDEQPDNEDVEVDQMEVDQMSDENVHEELIEDERTGDRKVDVGHMEDEADHLEDNKLHPFIETNRDAVEKHSTDVDQRPVFQAGFEELRTAEAITHPSEYEEDKSIAEDTRVAQQTHISTEDVLHIAEPPIDPELLNAGTFPTETQMGISQQDGIDSSQDHIQHSKASRSPEQPQHIDPSLSLDGFSQSTPIAGGVASKPSVSLQDQLVTPEPSQVAGTDKHPLPVPSAVETLPTPEPTQERSDMQLEVGTSLTVEPVPVTSATVNVDKDHDSKPEAHPSVEGEQYEGSGDEEIALPIHGDGVFLVGADRARLVEMNRNFPGLRSKYSYFAPLATLIDHYNALTDTISVVAEVRPPMRATSGKKDYVLTFGLTDPSLAGTILYAQIFRPYKAALPSLEEGDAVLLRNFLVKSFNHTMTLASVDTSAWAVFSATENEARVDGPPVEYGAEEQSYATDLRQWYHEGGMAMAADYQLQASIEQESRETTPYSNAGFSDSGSVISTVGEGRADSSLSGRASRRRKSHRRITIHELRDGRRYAEVGSPSSKESIHELRDGTVYANF